MRWTSAEKCNNFSVHISLDLNGDWIYLCLHQAVRVHLVLLCLCLHKSCRLLTFLCLSYFRATVHDPSLWSYVTPKLCLIQASFTLLPFQFESQVFSIRRHSDITLNKRNWGGYYRSPTLKNKRTNILIVQGNVCLYGLPVLRIFAYCWWVWNVTSAVRGIL